MNKHIPLIITSGIALLSIVILFEKDFIRCNYPSTAEYPFCGIDISHHQGTIDWNELSNETLRFIIIKATEGGDFIDSLFQSNYDSAKVYGYETGAYHFYRLCTDPEVQAYNFINSLRGKQFSIPPTVDLEFGGNCQANASRVEIKAGIHTFLEKLESYYGKPPIIYSTLEFYNEYLLDDFQENPVWIRNIFKTPELHDGRAWMIWQFTNRGRLKGIQKNVDMNVMQSNYVSLLHLNSNH